MRRGNHKYAVVRVVDNEDEAEAFGPFVSRDSAEAFCEDYGYWVSSYGYIVVELLPVRDGRDQIRDEKAADTAP